MENHKKIYKFYFVSLGCSKNLVDAEVMVGRLGNVGYKIITDPKDAHIIIINTCSFIDAAKAESIDTILEMSKYKDSDHGNCKYLVVTGCLPQRYSTELKSELPEVDLFTGTNEYAKIDLLLDKVIAKEKEIEKENGDRGTIQKVFVRHKNFFLPSDKEVRVNTSPFYTSWLKVSEGCNRMCSFCIIPFLRGPMRSRSVRSLVHEAKMLVSRGVREINLIAQDLSVYGKDLVSKGMSEKNNLVELLTSLEKIEGLDWIRLHYYYPDLLDKELISVIKNSKKVCHYLDMPVQHFSDEVLQNMNRKIKGSTLLDRVDFLKSEIPGIVLRTSVIVGFPGETEKDFNLLLKGIERAEFHNLGVFKYSDEEGTKAFDLDYKNDKSEINERYKEAYKLQKRISRKLHKKYLGTTLDVLVEGKHPETDLLLKGRYFGQSPDIDGNVMINEGHANMGDIVKVQITDTHDYDLVGKIIS